MGLRTSIRDVIKRFCKTPCSASPFGSSFDLLLEELKYELHDEITSLEKPLVKSVYDTIDDIIATRASLCRFGDGELRLIEGHSLEFQQASPLLSERLVEVLSSCDDRVFIAVPRLLFGSKAGVIELSKSFWRLNGQRYRKILAKYIDYGRTYYSAEVTIAYCMYENLDRRVYFDSIRKIWNDRDIAIVCGSGVFNSLEYNIFDNARTVQYVYGPSLNAFSNYQEVLHSTCNLSRDVLVCAILGPAAKVLCYDLTLRGYQALDLGHIAKSYDWFLRDLSVHGLADATRFFCPDR